MPREGWGTVLVSDRRLFDQLFYAQAGYFAAPAPARGKSYHQDSPIPQGGEILAGTGCQQLAQNVAGNGIGTLATAWPVQGAHRKPDGRFNGRGRERPPGSASGSASTNWQDDGGRLSVHAVRIRAPYYATMGAQRFPYAAPTSRSVVCVARISQLPCMTSLSDRRC